MALTPEQRKARLKEALERGMSRSEAERAVAFEAGDNAGDAFIYDDDDSAPKADDNPGDNPRP